MGFAFGSENGVSGEIGCLSSFWAYGCCRASSNRSSTFEPTCLQSDFRIPGTEYFLSEYFLSDYFLSKLTGKHIYFVVSVEGLESSIWV